MARIRPPSGQSRRRHPEISISRLQQIVDWLPGQKILVIGDLMLDRYILGRASRLSPEAPVPVLNMAEELINAGGAGNVAANVRAVGAKVAVVGVIGDDLEGQRLAELLREMKVDISGLLRDSRRLTTLKTRVMAGQQQLVRIDRESTEDCVESYTRQMVKFISQKIAGVDGVIISDYDKGAISSHLLGEVMSLAAKSRKLIVVDPKRRHFNAYKDVTLITPNVNEASSGTGIEFTGEDSIIAMGQTIISRLGCKAVLITRGEQGMSLFEDKDTALHIPAMVSQVYDVTGAGDTVSAIATLALAAGASNLEAAVLANIAAGVVVRKPRVALVTREELKDELLRIKENTSCLKSVKLTR